MIWIAPSQADSEHPTASLHQGQAYVTALSGYIDQQTLSSDAHLKCIEDDFRGGQALGPKTDGRWDPRPDVREDEPILGDTTDDFHFNQSPRAPLLLPTNPATDSPSVPSG